MIAPDNPVRIHTICVSLGAMIAKVAAALYLEENGWIMHHVGHGKQTAPVRCYLLDDKLTVDKGNGWDGALKPVKP
ncbi:MAG TPA: hypothetical protein VN253_07060 [Kofleriaceae bacterium]|nr:hypothetical protein [Kofleriaceae bacterium]